jgi:hypothetical protein
MLLFCEFTVPRTSLDCVCNVMAHAQKLDSIFRRNVRVHLNRRGRQFSWLLAAELCASAVVMLDTPCSEVVWRLLVTHSIHQFPLHLPSRASPCAITFHLDCTFIPNHKYSSFSLLFVLFNVTWYGARRHRSVEYPLPFHYKESNYAHVYCKI